MKDAPVRSRIASLRIVVLTAMLSTNGQLANAAESVTQSSPTTECIGHLLVKVPSPFQYAVVPIPYPTGLPNYLPLPTRFANGPDAWKSSILLSVMPDGAQLTYDVSEPALAVDLKQLIDRANQNRANDRAEIEKSLAAAGSEGLRALYQDQLDAIADAQPVRGVDGAFFLRTGKDPYVRAELQTELFFLADGRIVRFKSSSDVDPSLQLASLFTHYTPRRPGVFPAGPGSCVPYGFIADESSPADVAVNLRLVSRPDIFVFIHVQNAKSGVNGSQEFIESGSVPMAAFYNSTNVSPIDRYRRYESVKIDGRTGKAAFFTIARGQSSSPSDGQSQLVEMTDWGYLAYIPKLSTGRRDSSFNLEVKIERISKYATQGMSEAQFRSLVHSITSQIKRR